MAEVNPFYTNAVRTQPYSVIPTVKSGGNRLAEVQETGKVTKAGEVTQAVQTTSPNSYKNSPLFKGDLVGVVKGIGVGDYSNTAASCGKDAGGGITYAFA